MTKDELQHVREALYRCLSHSSEHLHKAKQEALRILDAALAAPECACNVNKPEVKDDR